MNQNVNHVDHIVWASYPQNLEANVRRLEELTKSVLDGPFDRVDLGMRVCVSFASGVEIISPLEGLDTPMTRRLWSFLEKQGESMFCVVFGVPDIEEARQRARKMGYEPGVLLTHVGSEPWVHKTEKFLESVVGDFMGTMFAFGEIEYANGVFMTQKSALS
jgi:hypothetical protein